MAQSLGPRLQLNMDKRFVEFPWWLLETKHPRNPYKYAPKMLCIKLMLTYLLTRLNLS
jgi:hypothetical protein